MRLCIATLAVLLVLTLHAQNTTPASGQSAQSGEHDTKPTRPAVKNPPPANKGQDEGTASQSKNQNPPISVDNLPSVGIKKDGWDKAYICFTFLLVVVGGLTLAAIWYQAVQTRRAAEAAEESADSVAKQTGLLEKSIAIAKDSADAALLNAQVLIHAERAWLFTRIDPVIFDSYTKEMGQFTFRIVNSGKTPARIISIHNYPVYVDRGERLPPTPEYTQKGEFETAIVVLPGAHYTDETIELTIMSWVSAEPALENGSKAIWQYGLIRYKDALPDSPIRQTGYCYRYFPVLREWRLSGPRAYTDYT